ncbi:MAG: hypothetical protein V3U27_20080 [Candidatus Tectomicrobia bacterium]
MSYQDFGLRQKNPMAKTPLELQDEPEASFPEPYLVIEAEAAVINRIFELLNASRLTAHQAKTLLHRCLRLVAIGEIADKATH